MEQDEEIGLVKDTSLRESIYGILSALCRFPVTSPAIADLISLVQFLQEMSMPLSMTFPWNPSYMYGLSQFLSFVRYFWVGISPLIIQQVTAYFTVSIILLLVLYLALAVCVEYQQGVGKGSNLPGFEIYRKILDIFMAVCYIPCLSIIGHYLECQDSGSCSMIKTPPAETAILVLTLLVLICLAFVYTLTLYDWAPLSNNPFAIVHHRSALISLATRTVAALAFALFELKETSIENQYMLSVIASLHAFLSVYTILLELPYVQQRANAIYLCSNGALAWTCISSVITVAVQSKSDTGSVWLFFCGIVPIVPTCLYSIYWRQMDINRRIITALGSPLQVDLKARLQHQQILTNFNDQRFDNKVERDLFESDFSPVDDIFMTASRRFPESSQLYFSWATHAFYFKRNRFLAMSKLRSILRRQTSPLDVITVRMRLRRIADVSMTGDNEIDILRYVQQQKLEKSVKSEMEKCLNYLLQFWSHLASEKYTLEKMAALTYKLEVSMRKLRDELHQLVSTDPNYSYYRRLYAQYLHYMANDVHSANNQLQIALDLDSLDRDLLTDGIDGIHNGVLIISGEYYNMGQVLQVNTKACDIFGYQAIELLGKNVNTLMPRPYAETHNARLQNYIDKHESKLVNGQRQLIMRHQQGYVFRGILHVLEYANLTREPSISFLGAIKVEEREMNFIILRISTLMIVDVSNIFATTLSVDLQQVRNNDFHLSNCLPEAEEAIPEVIKGLETDAVFAMTMCVQLGNEEETEMSFYFSYLPYLPPEFLVIDIFSTTDQKAPNIMKKDQLSRARDAHDMEALGFESRMKGKRRGSTGFSGNDLGLSSASIGFSESIAGSRYGSMALRSQQGSRIELARSRGQSKDPSGNISDTNSVASLPQMQKHKGAPDSPSKNLIHGDEQEEALNGQKQILGMNTLAQTNQIRQVLEKSGSILEPTLRQLFTFIIVLVAMIIVLSIAAQVFWSDIAAPNIKILNQLILRGSLYRWSINTCEYASNIFFLIRSKLLFVNVELYRDAAGIITTTRYSDAIGQAATGLTLVNSSDMFREDLSRALLYFDSFREIVKKAEGLLPPEGNNLLNGVLVPLITFDLEEKYMNLVESSHFYSSMTSSILNSDFDELLKDSRVLSFFKFNMNSTLLTTLNQSINYFQLQEQKTNDAVNTIFLSIALAAMGFVVFMTLVFFLPTMYQLEREKMAVYRLFESIEVGNVRNIVSLIGDRFTQFTGKDFVLPDAVLMDAKKRNAKKDPEDNENGEHKENKGVDEKGGRRMSTQKKQELEDEDEENERRERKRARVRRRRNQLSTILVNMIKTLFANRSTLKLSLLIVVTAAYYGRLVSWWAERKTAFYSEIAPRVNHAGYREMIARQILVEITMLNDTTGLPSLNVDRLQQLEDQLWKVEDALTFGSRAYELDTDVRDWPYGKQSMSFAPLCPLVSGYISTSLCESYHHGVMDSGPHSLVLEFIALSQRLRYNYQLLLDGLGSDPTPAQRAEILKNGISSHLRDLKEMGDIYLPLSFKVAEKAIQASFMDELDAAAQYQQISTFLFIVVNVALLVLVYRPMVKELDTDMKKTRNALLLIPNEVFQASPALIAQFRATTRLIFKEAQYYG
jgi:PAS domain S-box-containing protein